MVQKQTTVMRGGALLVLLVAWALLLFRLNDVPPGMQHDQMFNSLDALSIGGGNYPIYFPANFGREFLGIYPVALMFELTGGHYAWSIRFTTVLWGMLAVSLTFVLARRYLSPWAALAAAALLAGSFWFLLTARLGLEPALLIPLATAAIYFLNRGLARRAWRDFAAAGVMGGLAVHTYLASRGLFVLLALLLGFEAVGWLVCKLRRQPARLLDTAMPGLLVTAAIMAAIAAPLFIYLETRPKTGDLRVGELGGAASAALAGDLRPLLANAGESVLAVLWSGSTAIPYHYNVPGRPVLEPVLAVFFGVGLVLTLLRLRRSTEFLLLAALFVGLLPNLITGADALHMRGVIALPLIFIVVTRGLWQTGAWIGARLPSGQARRTWPWLSAGLLALLLIWHTAATGVAYFVDWAQAERTQRIYNADFRAVATWLDANPTDVPVFIGTDRLIDLDSKVYALYEPARRDVTWFPAGEDLPLPAGDGALYFLPASTAALSPASAQLVEAASERFSLPGPSGKYDLVHGLRISASDVARVLEGGHVQPLTSPPVYGQAVRLDAAGARQQGDALELLTRWSAVGAWPFPTPGGQPRQPIKLSVSLVDSSGYKWAQVDQPSSLPWTFWRPGDTYLELALLPLPADLPPGDYAVRLALYDDVGGTAPASSGGAAAAADAVAAAVRISDPVAGAAPDAPYPFERTAGGDTLSPAGRWDPLDLLVVGVPGEVRLSWRADQPLETTGLRFQARALDPGGSVLWEQDAHPLQALPASWPAGQVYRLTHRLVPRGVSAGASEVLVEVCAVREGVELACGKAGQTQVVDQPPVMALPQPPQRAAEITWNDRFSLIGYDVAPEPETIGVTLYWRVEDAPGEVLKRFVHAVDAGGQIVAQADAVPANGALPMPFWRAGEIVTDRVVLPLPAGAGVGQLCLGWYEPESGERLPVRLPGGEDAPHRRACLPLD